MSTHHTFIWSRATKKLRQGEIWLEFFWITGLLLAALGLFLVGLGSLPLNNGEAEVARIASEIYHSASGMTSWIFPTLWGEPILKHPPLIANLIAVAYSLWGISEFTSRLPGALFSAVSVLILYKIGREIFIARLPALLAAGIYLTFLPVVWWGRLATFEGELLCLEILAIWAILRSRRDLKWTVFAGVALGAVGLSSGIQSLQILAVALLFLWWDTPRLIGSVYLWLGILLGSLPSISWYAAQWYRYRDAIAFNDMWQVLLEPIRIAEPTVYYAVVYKYLFWLQYLLPWGIVVFGGLQLVRSNLLWGWSKLISIWAGVTLLVVLLSINLQYWYVLPICPALALAGGAKLDCILNLPSYDNYPRSWSFYWGTSAVLIAIAGVAGILHDQLDFYLISICIALVLTLSTIAVLIIKREAQFISLLFWGLYVSLFIFVNSPYWIGEQPTFEPLKPLAALIEERVPPTEIVYTSETQASSALSFYSERQIMYLEPQQLERYWKESSSAYLLVDEPMVRQLDLPSSAIATLESEPGWFLAAKNQ